MLPIAGTDLALPHNLVIVGMALAVLGVAFYWLPAARVKMVALTLAILGGLTAAAALLLAVGGAGTSGQPIRFGFFSRSSETPDDPAGEKQFRQRHSEVSRKYPAGYDPLAARKKAFEETPDAQDAAGAGADDSVRIAPEKADLALVVNLHAPKDENFAKIQNILDKLKQRGATHRTLRASKDGEGASAEVLAQPQTPSSRIADVVKELLDDGIVKISVEVKK